MSFPLTRHARHDGSVTLAPAGELDLRTAGPLHAAIQDALSVPHTVEVVIDLGRVTFLSCAGISALVAGRNTAVRQGQRYAVVNPQRHVRRVLQITGVFGYSPSADPAQRTDQVTRSRRSGHRPSAPRNGRTTGAVDADTSSP
jgi:anti-anti-sigma factor